jgi:hypothetical protein
MNKQTIKEIRVARFNFRKMLPLWSILLKLDDVDYLNACNLVEDLIEEARREGRDEMRKEIGFIRPEEKHWGAGKGKRGTK